MAGIFGTLIKRKAQDENAGVKAERGRKAAEQAELDLEQLQLSNLDIETRHMRAEELLCDVLKAYGHDNLVAEFDAIDKDYG